MGYRFNSGRLKAEAIAVMDIQLGARVECTDGPCGRCAEIILNPQSDKVTHLVIQENRTPHTQRLVPIDLVMDSDSKLIRLRLKRLELAEMEDFLEREHVRVEVPPAYWPGEFTMSPIYFTPTAEVSVVHLRVPPGEIALSRDLRVHAADGPIGRVDEFLVDSADDQITHLVMREGHLWSRKQVVIPVRLIVQMNKDAVYLKLNKRHLGALSAMHPRGEREEKV